MDLVTALYDKAAHAYDEARGRSGFERPYLDAVLSRLPTENGHVLDLGCGGAEPMAQFFIERGHRVTGVDAAPAMIRMAQSRFPNETWIVSDMRNLRLDRRFDAILAWDSFFHLPQDDQQTMFPIFRDHIKPGGCLLFTAGPKAGEVWGDLQGEPLFHASLSTDSYQDLLDRHGFRVLRHVIEDPACGQHTVWLAQQAV